MNDEYKKNWIFTPYISCCEKKIFDLQFKPIDENTNIECGLGYKYEFTENSYIHLTKKDVKITLKTDNEKKIFMNCVKHLKMHENSTLNKKILFHDKLNKEVMEITEEYSFHFK